MCVVFNYAKRAHRENIAFATENGDRLDDRNAEKWKNWSNRHSFCFISLMCLVVGKLNATLWLNLIRFMYEKRNAPESIMASSKNKQNQPKIQRVRFDYVCAERARQWIASKNSNETNRRPTITRRLRRCCHRDPFLAVRIEIFFAVFSVFVICLSRVRLRSPANDKFKCY